MTHLRSRRSYVAGALLALAAVLGIRVFISTDTRDAFARWIVDGFRAPSVQRAHVVIDGFPIGGPAVCEAPSCEAWTSFAQSALDEREPHHPDVVGLHVHEEDMSNTLVVAPGAATRSTLYVIVVFDLADGSHRAAGVSCSPIHCRRHMNYPS